MLSGRRALGLLGSTVQAILGGLVGGIFGFTLTLAVVIAMARAGNYIFALHDLAAIRWETLPVPVGLAVGAWLGERKPTAYWQAVGLGVLGFALGAAAGALVGTIFGLPAEWRWALGYFFAIAAGWTLTLRRLWPALRTHHGEPEEPEQADVPEGANAVWVWGMALVAIILGAWVVDVAARSSPAVETDRPTPPRIALPDPDDVESVTILVGDAGLTIEGRSPLLEALRHDIENWSRTLDPSAVSVMFLGDLVYPVGVRDTTHRAYPQDSTRLWNQVDLLAGEEARTRSATGWFLPGNHDWGNTSGQAGLDRIMNLDRELQTAREMGIEAIMQPPFGGPGPAIVDVGDHLRLAMIDTHWFLQNQSRDATDEFIASTSEALRTAGDRHVVFAAHHPYRSAGPHGATVPLYPAWGIGFLLKKTGSIVQDLNSRVYADLLERMHRVFQGADRPPLVFAGGHDHSLQVLAGETDADPTHVLVSGSGSKISLIDEAAAMDYGAAQPGYMWLVTRKDGRVALYVIAGAPDRLLCPEGDPDRYECMVMAENEYEVVFSKILAGPVGPDGETLPPREEEGDVWWTARSPDSVSSITPEPDEAGRQAPPVAVPMRTLYFEPDSVVTTPGKAYEANPIEEVVSGEMHRRLWTLPVTLPVLDLDTLGGGVTFDEATGGMQTFGARFTSERGPIYQFRSIVKDARAVVPEPLRESPVGGAVNEQMAAQFPLAAMVVAELLEAVGSHVARPVPVVLPNSERLGPYRPLLAGRVGWLEVWPNEREDDRPGFAGSRHIIDGESILQELEENPEGYVDAEAYLRVRLMDILVGDWDRHVDQWRWASFPDSAGIRWEPISRDRDWAFNRSSAIPEALSGIFLPRYVSFERDYPPVNRLVETGAPIDTVLLANLSEADFVAVARDIESRLTDEALMDAVGVLPPSYREEVGTELFSALRTRRDGLVQVARDFHADLRSRFGG